VTRSKQVSKTLKKFAQFIPCFNEQIFSHFYKKLAGSAASRPHRPPSLNYQPLILPTKNTYCKKTIQSNSSFPSNSKPKIKIATQHNQGDLLPALKRGHSFSKSGQPCFKYEHQKKSNLFCKNLKFWKFEICFVVQIPKLKNSLFHSAQQKHILHWRITSYFKNGFSKTPNPISHYTIPVQNKWLAHQEA
jgi:hypothetical protein